MQAEDVEVMKKVFKYGDAHYFKIIDPKSYLNKALQQYEETLKLARKKI
jgi:hypothetical protein